MQSSNASSSSSDAVQPQPQSNSSNNEIQVTDYDTIDITRVPIEVKLAALGVDLTRQTDETDELLRSRAFRARGAHLDELAALEDCGAPIVRLFGLTELGEPHVIYMRDVWPYLYLQAPAEMRAEHLEAFVDYLHFALPDIRVRRIELLRDCYDLMYYSATPQPVLRITLHKPQQVTKLRDFWFGPSSTLPPIVWGGMNFVRHVFEANVVFNRRICVDKGIVPFSWVRIHSPSGAASSVTINRCVHTLLPQQQVEALGCAGPRSLICPKLRVASYDIECKGLNNEFPNAQRDPIISISVVLYEGADCANILDAVVFITVCEIDNSDLGRGVLRPQFANEADNEEAKRFRVVECADERLMLIMWAQYLREASHMNFLVGYNTDRFDTEYVRTRAQLLSCWREVGRLSPWDTSATLQLRKSTQNTRAYGKSDDNNVRVPGVLNVDVFRIVKKEARLKDGTKPRSYKLGDISASFLSERNARVITKRDLPYTQIGPHWSGTPEQRWTLCDYNEWDSRLVGMLCNELCTLTNLVSMARVTSVDVTELVCGGQQIKVYMQMLALARSLHFVIPTLWREPAVSRTTVYGELDSDFTVQEEAQQQQNTAVAAAEATAPEKKDKEKLDPQMRLGATPLVDEDGTLIDRITNSAVVAKPPTVKKLAKDDRQKAYDGAVVIEPERGFYEQPITTLDFSSLYPSIMRAHNLSHDTLVDAPMKCAHGHCMYKSEEALQCCVHATPLGARFVNESVRRGLLPQLLAALMTERGAAKRAMAAAKSESEKAVHDGRQSALKISANSVYGFTGALLGILPCIDISAGVTAYGRDMIMDIKDTTERVYSLANGYHSNSRVIYGDSVTGDTPVMIRLFGDVEEPKLTSMSMLEFYAHKNYVSWHGDKEHIVDFCPLEVWTKSGWTPIRRIIRHKAPGKRLVRVLTPTGCVDVTEDHSLLRGDGTVVSPKHVKLGDELLHSPLPYNQLQLFSGHNLVDKSSYISIVANGKCRAAKQFFLLKLLGMQVTIDDCDDDLTAFRITGRFVGTDDKQQCASPPLTQIIKIRELGLCTADQYVYDLETEDHTFAAGIGELVVHNTDSIMVKFNVYTVDDARKIGMEAATLINALFDLRMMSDTQRIAVIADVSAALGVSLTNAADLLRALERNPAAVAPLISGKYRGVITIIFEKVLLPMLLINKKRYAGGFWLRGDHMDHQHVSGIECVRRDNSEFTNELIRNVISIMIKECSLEPAIKYARKQVRALARGKIPFEKLIVSKGYTKAVTDYVDGPKRIAGASAEDKHKDALRYTGAQPHLIVVRKRLERTMQPYKMGERVPYVLVYKQGQDAMRPGSGKTSLKKQTQSDIVEDPEYAQKHKLMPNTEYYLKHQAEKPLTRIFDTARGKYTTIRTILTADVTSVAIAPVGEDERYFGAFKSAGIAAAASTLTDSGMPTLTSAAASAHLVAEADTGGGEDSSTKRQKTTDDSSAGCKPLAAAMDCDVASSCSLSDRADPSTTHNSVLFMSTKEKLEWLEKDSKQDTKMERFFPVEKRTLFKPKITPVKEPKKPAAAAGKKTPKKKKPVGPEFCKRTWI